MALLAQVMGVEAVVEVVALGEMAVRLSLQPRITTGGMTTGIRRSRCRTV
jgi:hypothetical protein